MVRIKPLLSPQQLRSALSPITCQNVFQRSILSIRASSTSTSTQPPQIPAPTPFVPDVDTFLTVIGRGLRQHASKFPTWEALFSLTSDQMRELGIEPPRTRRYLLQWRQRFRLGQFGIGGDFQHVKDGNAELRILTSDKDPLRLRKFVVNVPADKAFKECTLDDMFRVRGYKVKGAKTIVGPYTFSLKEGKGCRVTVTEGMWEDRRGHKVDGGERRRTQVRYKRRIAERRELREKGEL
ncbi:IGR protein motif-domain-containing protein [Whalleya microplaca]|nr:IGR protein motif-domain-containing protein [Whalleya microplaca]